MRTSRNYNRLIAGIGSTSLALTLLAGCGDGGAKHAPLPGRVGAIGEVVIVCSASAWEGAIGDSLHAHFDRPYPVLPQYEPMLDLVHLPLAEFDKFWKPHRNIIHVEIADRVDTQEPTVKIFRNRHSSGQLYVEAKGRTVADLAKMLALRAAELISVFHEEEVRRAGEIIALNANEVIARDLRQDWNIDLVLPRDARWATQNRDFGWIDRQLTRWKGGDNHDVQQGFFVYREKYTDDSLFTMKARIRKRNQMLRAYVSGPTEGSYMTTELAYFPSYEEFTFNGEFACSLRGLWKMENDFMGGPFYSLTMYDKSRGELVTVEGYAYAPYFDKRPYMREVESVVRSVVVEPDTLSRSWEVDASIRALDVVDGSEVWYAGSNGRWGRTVDAGKNWQHGVLSHEDVAEGELAFRAVAVTDHAAHLLNVGSPALLYRSTDEGANWDVVYREDHPGVFYDAMAFWDGQEGLAFGDPTDGCMSVLITRDRGENWTKVPCENLPEVAEGEAAFAASNSNIAVHGDAAWCATGGTVSRVLFTPDRGRTWTVQPTPIVQGGGMTGLFSLAMYDAKRGVGIGGDWEKMDDNSQNKIFTGNGGSSWSLLTPGRGPGYRSSVRFVPGSDGQEIWAVGIPGVARSSNGGRSWTNIPDSAYYTVRFTPDGRVAWLAGRGKIARLSAR